MDWPSVRDPEEPGCPFCEALDGEVHQVECPLVGPEEIYGSVGVDGDTPISKGDYSKAQAKALDIIPRQEPTGGSRGREWSAEGHSRFDSGTLPFSSFRPRRARTAVSASGGADQSAGSGSAKTGLEVPPRVKGRRERR